MEMDSGVSSLVIILPPTSWKKARASAASLVTSVRGRVSPTSRARRSWWSLSWPARAAGSGSTQRAWPSPPRKPSSAARVSRRQASRKRGSSSASSRGVHRRRSHTARTSSSARDPAPSRRVWRSPVGVSREDRRSSPGNRSVSTRTGRAPRRARAAETRSTVKWSPPWVSSRTEAAEALMGEGEKGRARSSEAGAGAAKEQAEASGRARRSRTGTSASSRSTWHRS